MRRREKALTAHNSNTDNWRAVDVANRTMSHICPQIADRTIVPSLEIIVRSCDASACSHRGRRRRYVMSCGHNSITLTPNGC